MNETNKRTKQNQRHGGMEQTDSDQSGGREGDNGGMKKGLVKEHV